jgi:hypothetical protein
MKSRDHTWGLTQKHLRSILRYEPDTGFFIRLDDRGGQDAGSIAGSLSTNGYITISIRLKGRDRRFRAHRLAWFYVKGRWPKRKDVEHENTIRTDNRWSNLRLGTRSQNLQNMSPRGGSSKFKGVYYDKERDRWQAYVGTGAKRIRLGRFDDEEEAARAYDRVAAKVYGRFARLNFPQTEAGNTGFLSCR